MFAYPNNVQEALGLHFRRGEENPISETLLQEIVQLLDIAYQASLLREEGRPIEFRILLLNEKMKDYLNKNEIGLHLFLPFSPSRKFSPSEILRLAPATDFSKTLICVTPTHQGSNSPFSISGLLHELNESESFIFPRGYPANRPRAIIIHSLSAGEIKVSYGRSAATLRRGRLFYASENVFSESSISRKLSKAQGQFFQKVNEKIQEDVRNSKAFRDVKDFALESFEVPSLTKNFRPFELILSQAKDLRHGGAVIVADRSELAEIERKVKIKYQVRSFFLREALIESAYSWIWSEALSCPNSIKKDVVMQYRNRKGGRKSPNHKIPAGENLEKNRVHVLPVDDIRHLPVSLMIYLDSDAEINKKAASQGKVFDIKLEKEIYEMVSFIASLTQVDGAVMMTSDLELIGFGCELLESDVPYEEIKISTKAFSEKFIINPEEFGTRHRSAFRFCHKFPLSLCFVISQDGSIRGISKDDQEIEFWPDLNVRNYFS